MSSPVFSRGTRTDQDAPGGRQVPRELAENTA